MNASWREFSSFSLEAILVTLGIMEEGSVPQVGKGDEQDSKEGPRKIKWNIKGIGGNEGKDIGRFMESFEDDMEERASWEI